MIWDDVDVGYVFDDGSKLIQRHNVGLYDCYKLYYDNKEIVLSKDHLLQVNIKSLPYKIKKHIRKWAKGYINTQEEIKIDINGYVTEEEKQEVSDFFYGKKIKTKVEDISTENYEVYLFDFEPFSRDVWVKRFSKGKIKQKITRNLYWLPVEGIVYLMNIFNINIPMSTGVYIQGFEYVGKQPAFCVSTDTKEYKMNGLVHHNSVLIMNIVFHILAHWNEIASIVVDIKMIDFQFFKGENKIKRGLLGVANDVASAAEVLRIARIVMYKRNKEVAKLKNISKISEYEPKDKTDYVFITGREYHKDDLIKVRENGKEKEMTAGAIADYLHGN